MNSFSTLHPSLLFAYYISVIFISMFTMNPIILGLSLAGSLLFYAILNQREDVFKDLIYYSFVFLLIAVTNPLFSHNGETILFFLNDNPVTYEAIIYGIAIGAMLVSVMFWSKSYNDVMTSDKFLYLFGKLIPKLSLVLSMALRFIPMMKQQIKKVNESQKTLGLYSSDSITDRVLGSIRVFNSVLTWSLENAINQSDSMKARGYGLKGRTDFSLFKFNKRDRYILIMVLSFLSIITFGFIFNTFEFYYYPAISKLEFSVADIMQYIIVSVLMILPFLMEVKENIQWKLLKSKI